MNWLGAVGLAISLFALLIIIYDLIRQRRKWEQEFMEEAALLLMRMENPNIRRKLAEVLLLASWRDGYPKKVRELLEMHAGAKMREVWERHGL